MRLRSQYLLTATVVIASVVSLTIAAAELRADEAPLRWKFDVGEKLNYNMVQEMNMSAQGGPVGQMTTTMRQEMDMVWDVQGVDKKTGEAVIKQKFDRLKMKMQTPYGGFEYDSKSEAAPTGLATMIAPMYKAMTSGEFEITMTARGEVKDVKIPEDVLTALKAAPGAAAMGDIASADGFKKMISQGALVLPEGAPKKDDKWTTKVEMNNPAFGKQTVETTYVYDGVKEMDGAKFAVIKPQLKMEFENKPGAAQPMTMKIADQSSEGEVLFNIDQGRLSSTTLQQKVTIDATVNGQSLQQKIEQNIDVKVSPVGEKTSDADEQPKDVSAEKASKDAPPKKAPAKDK
jgi:hypothetical protein